MVVAADPPAAVVVVAPLPGAPLPGAVVVGAVVVVVVVVVGRTKGVVSPVSVAWVAVGVAERLVQLRAANQL